MPLIQFFQNNFNIILLAHAEVFPIVSFLRMFPPQSCTRVTSLPRMKHTPPIIYGEHEAPHYADAEILTVTTWKSCVYHLLPTCHVYTEFKIMLSASECYSILWNTFPRRAERTCLYAPLKDEVTAGTVLFHNTESATSEGKRTVPLLKMTSGGNEENNEKILRWQSYISKCRRHMSYTREKR
jgi:hypothetical protein